ncbi:MAG: lasso RiPP family leader peptide-containing protein [Solirubrobacteraceae bacterium]|jgi:hypothetical protein
MNDRHHDPHADDRSARIPGTPDAPAYEPPALTRLGTLAELTHGTPGGHTSDLTFPVGSFG